MHLGLYSSIIARAGPIPVNIRYSARCERMHEKHRIMYHTRIAVNFHVQANATSCHSNFEIHRVMTEQLFKALEIIETLASGTMKVYVQNYHMLQTY